MLSHLKFIILQARKRSLAKRDWRARYRAVFAKHPQLSKSVVTHLEQEHKRLWSPLLAHPNLDTLRLCVNLSGRESSGYVPEELFVTEIEPCLNTYDSAAFLANKSVYSRWFPETVLPLSYLHNIDGQFFAQDYRLISRLEVDDFLDHLRYPVVLKPTIDSGGGRDVSFPKNAAELRSEMEQRENYVVQEQIVQHQFFAALNAGKGKGVNTLRVCVYRSVVDNTLHILNIALRIGNVGTLDNDAAGGVACYVSNDGTLNGYGVDKYGTRYDKHPASGLAFSEIGQIPSMDELRALVLKLAQDVWLIRLMSFDICMDEAGNWRLIEVNLRGQTIRFSQYAGYPFFRNLTGEVIRYCLERRHKKLGRG